MLVILAGAQAVETAAQQPTSAAPRSPWSIEAVAPLSGCWEGGLGELDMREQWTDGQAGAMLGTTRYFREGELVDFEFAMITEADEGVVLWPYPRGVRSEHGFPLVDAGRTLVFENLDHDFPVRIMYERLDDDRLAPRIEGRDGEGRGWELRRVPCPS